ncbi:MAG TPA: AI-2E family transporter [Euzebyales bacterium]|nr:AI-2E family transporter [Euzebyales bacterium]
MLRIEVAGRTVWQMIGAILLTLLLLRVAASASGLLSMVALSFFFSLALDPAVRWLCHRYDWRRGAAVGVIYLTGVVFVGFMVFILIPAIRELAARIAESGDEWIAQLNAWTSANVGLPLDADVASGVVGAGEAVGGFADDAFGMLAGIASGGIALVFNMATIAMFTFYLTAQAPAVKRSVLRLFTPTAQQRIGWAWDQAITQTGGYFYSRMILMLINGGGFLLTMIIVGLPVTLALPLAVFAGFVSVFIPAVGTYIGAAIPILITLAIQGLIPGVIVLAYALVYQQVENYVLSPRISADTMALNGGVAFGAALAGGAIAGPVGAFVALPVAALISASVANYARSYEVVYRSQYDEVQDADDDPAIGVAGAAAYMDAKTMR